MSPQLRALRQYEPLEADQPAPWITPDDVPTPRAASGNAAVLNARRLLMFVVEAVDGRRPLSQLTDLLTTDALKDVHRVLAPGLRARLGRLHTCRVSELAVEIAGTVTQNTRVRALAARLELREGTWQCTVFRLLP